MAWDASSALQNRCWLRGATVLVCYCATYVHLRIVSGYVAFGGVSLSSLALLSGYLPRSGMPKSYIRGLSRN